MTTLVDTFARNLRSARKARGLTQTALAHAAGVACGYVSMLENAQRDPPLSTVSQLAAALNMAPLSLLTESEAPHA